jgi:hypothetical protein
LFANRSRITHEDTLVISLERLLGFIGFGDPDPRVVLAGLEEGFRTTRPDKVQALRDELILRSSYPANIIDLRDSFVSHDIAEVALASLGSPTWRNISHIMLAHRGQTHEEHTPGNLRAYQQRFLGAKTSGSLLIELMPLPSPTMEDWLYSQIPEIGAEYPNRPTYREKVWPTREKLLRGVFERVRPSLVVCYGKGRDWRDFRNLFRDVSFGAHGPFTVGAKGSMRVILSPHLSRLNEIEALESLVRGG